MIPSIPGISGGQGGIKTGDTKSGVESFADFGGFGGSSLSFGVPDYGYTGQAKRSAGLSLDILDPKILLITIAVIIAVVVYKR